MRTIRSVFLKEVVDNFRDRRTLISALLMGPIFGPVLFAMIINLSVSRAIDSANEALDVPVIGADYAPNLVTFLESQNLNLVDPPASRQAAIESVRSGEQDVVVVIPESIDEDLSSGTPVRIEVITDQANTTAERDARRAVRALGLYNQQLAIMRLTVRGVNPTVLQPLTIDQVDVSTPSGRSAILLGMLSYFFIASLLTGGMNLAIDSTAGERERGSLEPLLCLPVLRDHLIVGKIAAACLFMALSLALSLTAFHFTLKFLPLQELGLAPNFGLDVVVSAFLLLLPFTLIGASLMTLIASFTKSYKEAQTWLTAVILAPTLPILVVSILMIRPTAWMMLIPSMSQHLLIVSLIKNEAINWLYVLLSVSGTMALGLLLVFATTRLYRREGLLG